MNISLYLMRISLKTQVSQVDAVILMFINFTAEKGATYECRVRIVRNSAMAIAICFTVKTIKRNAK